MPSSRQTQQTHKHREDMEKGCNNKDVVGAHRKEVVGVNNRADMVDMVNNKDVVGAHSKDAVHHADERTPSDGDMTNRGVVNKDDGTTTQDIATSQDTLLPSGCTRDHINKIRSG